MGIFLCEVLESWSSTDPDFFTLSTYKIKYNTKITQIAVVSPAWE